MGRPIEDEPGYKTLSPEQQKSVSAHYRRIQAEGKPAPAVTPAAVKAPKEAKTPKAPKVVAPKKKSFLRSAGSFIGASIVKGGKAYLREVSRNTGTRRAPRRGGGRKAAPRGGSGTVVHVHLHGGGGSSGGGSSRKAPRRAAPKRRKPKRDPWDLGIRI